MVPWLCPKILQEPRVLPGVGWGAQTPGIVPPTCPWEGQGLPPGERAWPAQLQAKALRRRTHPKGLETPRPALCSGCGVNVTLLTSHYWQHSAGAAHGLQPCTFQVGHFCSLRQPSFFSERPFLFSFKAEQIPQVPQADRGRTKPSHLPTRQRTHPGAHLKCGAFLLRQFYLH